MPQMEPVVLKSRWTDDLPSFGGVRWSRCWWKLLIVLAILLPLKLTSESRLHALGKASGLFASDFTANVRGKLSQGAALAVLSGFRGIVADFTWLSAHGDWERREWFRMKPKLDTVVTLQPHFIDYWDIGAWHMAWNISYDVSVNPAEPREAFRLKEQRQWIDEGEKFLREALTNNPESWALHFKLGWLLDQKKHDYVQAAEWFRKAAEFAEAPIYVRRQVGHALTKAGKKQEALAYWKKLWAEPRTEANSGELWDRIEAWIRELEVELNVPPSQRTFPVNSYPDAGKASAPEVRKPAKKASR